jgi:hypothetical protein
MRGFKSRQAAIDKVKAICMDAIVNAWVEIYGITEDKIEYKS